MSSLIAYHILAGDLWGGREAQLEAQLAALRALGVDARAVLFNEEPVAARLRESGIPVEVIPEAAGLGALLFGVRRAVRDGAIVIGHGYKEALAAAFATRFRRAAFVLELHGAAEPFPGWRGMRMRMLERFTCFLGRSLASRIVCVSKELATRLRLEGQKLRVIYNCVTKAEPATTGERLFPENALVSVGRLVRVKRFDVAIRAVALLEPPVTLSIVGSGALEPELRALVGELGLERRVTFHGFREDATAHLHEATALLIASDSEGIPTVLLDAIRVGVPILSTSVGGIPEVCELFPSYPSALVRAGDPAAMAAGLRELLARRARPDDGRFRTLDERFSAEAAARQHLELYREVVSS